MGQGCNECSVLDKYTGEVFAEVSEPSAEQVAQAVTAARKAFTVGAPPPHARAAVLRRCAESVDKNRKRFIDHIVADAGFTVADATGELERAIVTLMLSAEEATRLVGEQVAFAASPGQHKRIGFTIRVPLGIVCAITPFNSPLTPLYTRLRRRGERECSHPQACQLHPAHRCLAGRNFTGSWYRPGVHILIQGRGSVIGNVLLKHQDIDFYGFTGSTEVGEVLQQAAGLRKTQLELGSIASTIVCDDADLVRAIPKIANASFRKAGQVCTSIQSSTSKTELWIKCSKVSPRGIADACWGCERPQNKSWPDDQRVRRQACGIVAAGSRPRRRSHRVRRPTVTFCVAADHRDRCQARNEGG